MNNAKQEKLSGIVKRVTFHSAETGWSVLKITPFGKDQEEIAVTVHQSQVFAGATMDFYGNWFNHPHYGMQFKAQKVEERKPATTHALEKYLGSGLIKGVGPKTARKIVKHLGKDTLTVFDHQIDRLTEIPGIAARKLASIQAAWQEHQDIREVMMFLQSHGISTLFAVKIYKTYGQQAVPIVQDNPYRLAQDIYGIGFLSADKVALSLGLARDSTQRIQAGISHILQHAREEGHCYLTKEQILDQTLELLALDDGQRIENDLWVMEKADELKTRILRVSDDQDGVAFYAHSLYYDENYLAKKGKQMALARLSVDQKRVHRWINKYCEKYDLTLSDEQQNSVSQVLERRLSILTGGPGCGKTTTTKVIVALLKAMGKQVMLAAPTGRAAQRMSEVIGMEARTIHRLLEWDPLRGGFKRNEDSPLACDFLIVDESSMLDVHLAASLFKAVPDHAQLLLIGDADQLPSVGAGYVFGDMIDSGIVKCARLTQVFRQASQSAIIQHAHSINEGIMPIIPTPFQNPQLWQSGIDCLFIDAEEATQEQLRFIRRVKNYASYLEETEEENVAMAAEESQEYRARPKEFHIPEKFLHVDIAKVLEAPSYTEELKEVMRRVSRWSALHWGLTASDMVIRLYQDIIPRYYGNTCEIQVLSPMTKGSLGTHRLNELLQQSVNPATPHKGQLIFGGRTFRVGDRVIQRKNNYDLHIFNGDIGEIISTDAESMQCSVRFRSGTEEKEVVYEKANLTELELAYAVTIHKSQGSEFEAVIIPILSQHYAMLYRNLIYTALTRARKLAVFVGNRHALKTAIFQQKSNERQTALKWLLEENIS